MSLIKNGEVYDMCDQEWLSEDIIWRVVIGSNRQLGGLGNLCVYYKILKVQCGSPRGYEYWTTYIGYVLIYAKRDTNAYSILDILFGVTQWSWTDVYDEWTLQSTTSWINININIYNNIV